MKMNAGTWIGLIGGLVGLLVGISVVIATAGSAGIYITIGIIALFCGMIFLFYKLFFGPMLNASRLQKTGLPGTARILEVRDTGVTINNNPQVKLKLEVKDSLGQRYNTECRLLVSRINPNAYSVGMELPVKIDPKNQQNVVVDFSGATTTAAGANSEQLRRELEKMEEENNAIAQSGKAARAIIKRYNWLGAYVNGDNPYAELDLEVLPDNATAFSGKARGVIAAASLQKYQPGCEVYVKYDLYDNSRIVIDHS
jgi:hypothetical protein